MPIFYLFPALVVLQSLVSLRGGVRWLALFRRGLEARRPLYMPRASVLVPCRGVDQGLRENLAALFAQHYPAYELVFVSDRAEDPALAVAERLSRELGGESAGTARTRFVVAGRASACGQKVHNLRAGVAAANPSSEVLVFVDTDARPRPDWLRALVAPLEDQRVGAATGYRWFLPVRGGLASQLRSVWNASIASALGHDDRRNFCWGGSTAVRRETFERLNVSERWRGAVSDDYALTRAPPDARLALRFVARARTLLRVAARRRLGRLPARRVEGFLPPARRGARARRPARGAARRSLGAPPSVALHGGTLPLQLARRRPLAPHHLARHRVRVEVAGRNCHRPRRRGGRRGIHAHTTVRTKEWREGDLVELIMVEKSRGHVEA